MRHTLIFIFCAYVASALAISAHAQNSKSVPTKTGTVADKPKTSRSTETAKETIPDYGSVKGNGSSQDALSFETQDYSNLEMDRIQRQQYLGPYVSLPTTPTPEMETAPKDPTEAEFCLFCALSQMQIPPINMNGTLGGSGGGNGQLSGGIPLGSVTSYSNLSPDEAMKQAIKQMCDYVKKNPSCGPNKYAIVSDASRGSSNIRTAIIDISTCGTNGDAKVADMFPTGGGSGGIGNVSGSHATPPGFFKLTESGRNTRKNWPTCTNGNSFNYFIMEGQGCKYKMPGESCQNTNARAREILYHTWPQVGASTWGCTGVPQDRFCSWGDKIKGSCLYNYTGS